MWRKLTCRNCSWLKLVKTPDAVLVSELDSEALAPVSGVEGAELSVRGSTYRNSEGT